MPWPLSSTETRKLAGSAPAYTRTRPPRGVYLTALSISDCTTRISLGEQVASPASWTATSTRTSRSAASWAQRSRSEEHTSELQSRRDLVCRLLLEKKKQIQTQ